MSTITKEKLTFKVTTKENAPEASKEVLGIFEDRYGFAANIFGVMGNHPGLLNSYFKGNEQLVRHSVLTTKEREVSFLAASYENDCGYCMSSHSAVAGMLNIDNSTIEALRNGTTIPDTKLEALANYVKAITVRRGKASHEEVQAFLNAGFPKEALLEIILIVAQKTLTNYTDHIGNIELDGVFHTTKWTPK